MTSNSLIYANFRRKSIIFLRRNEMFIFHMGFLAFWKFQDQFDISFKKSEKFQNWYSYLQFVISLYNSGFFKLLFTCSSKTNFSKSWFSIQEHCLSKQQSEHKRIFKSNHNKIRGKYGNFIGTQKGWFSTIWNLL